MQQKLFHSALCEFLACITVCGACLSIKMHSIGTKEGNDDTKGALRGVLLISLANASACSARLKIVWDLPGTTSTSTLFPHNPSVLHETGAVDMQGREQQISSGFFQSKAVVKSSHTNDVESNSSVHIDEPSESILSQSQKLLTISNLTSCLPNSPEYLCDLAISLVESYVSINDSYPNPIPSSVTSVLSLDLLVLHWRKIEVLTLLKR